MRLRWSPKNCSPPHDLHALRLRDAGVHEDRVLNPSNQTAMLQARLSSNGRYLHEERVVQTLRTKGMWSNCFLCPSPRM